MKNLIINSISVFQISVVIISLYYLILSFFGLYKKQINKIYKPEKSFALLVAAHNEEAVIGKIIESLKDIDYPKYLYDIFIIADNCTDSTARIARKFNVNVFERFNKNEKGKGFALDWMFKKIFKMQQKYDAVAIFDADNLVSKNFLNEMNNKMLEGMKLFKDTWIVKILMIHGLQNPIQYHFGQPTEYFNLQGIILGSRIKLEERVL